ncbi:MAG TPA: hypothetical protein DDY58_04685, partial [Terrisporobacter glycolicus]|uniref:hypothetical protein n=1 Tax=Terrisporobacter hibernicus TaxID=2813371 RepID=UPI000E8B24B4
MSKTELILTLLNINKIGKKTINKLILNPLPSSVDSFEIFNFIVENLPNYKLNLNIQDVIWAKNQSLNIINYCKKN